MKAQADIINPFIEATNNCLLTFANTKPQLIKIFQKNDNHIKGDISAIMALDGDIQGSVILSFFEPLACYLVSSMAQFEMLEINDLVEDGVQELLNQVAGQAKNDLASSEFNFKMAIPTCVRGENHHAYHIEGIPCIGAEFQINNQPFFLEVALGKRQ